MSSTSSTIITRSDRRRHADATTAIALLFAETSRLSNRDIACMLRNSEYGVRKVRQLLTAQGKLGIVPGAAPALAPIPETTRGELGTAIADSADLLDLADADGVDGPTLRLLRSLQQHAISISTDYQQPLQTLAEIAHALTRACDEAEDEYVLMSADRGSADQIKLADRSPAAGSTAQLPVTRTA